MACPQGGLEGAEEYSRCPPPQPPPPMPHYRKGALGKSSGSLRVEGKRGQGPDPLCSQLLYLVSIKAAPRATEISLRCNQASSPQARAVTPSCGLPPTPLTPALTLCLSLCLSSVPPFVT